MKITLKGHESFVLREGWLTKGLQAVADNPKVFSKAFYNGADTLGVGTNMAKSIRYWLKAGNLTCEMPNHDVVLTPLGKTILKYDAYFEDVFSLWLVHIGIVLNEIMATTWFLFFNQMDLSSFTIDDMFNYLTNELYSRYRLDKISERSLRDDCNAICAMYGGAIENVKDPEDKKTSPFAVLGLLNKNKNRYEKKHPAMEILPAELILYLIADRLAQDGSLTIDEIVSGIGMPGKVLNLSRIAANQYLDRLAEKDMITINRTAGLDIVYPGPLMPLSADIVRNHYEGNQHE